MAVIKKIFNGAEVKREDAYITRWIDAMGENVVKYSMGIGIPQDDTTTVPTQFANTETGANAAVNSVDTGGGLKITTGVTEYNGVNMQVHGSAFKIETGKPCYFGIKCKTEDVAKGDFLVGLCEIDTTLLATSAAHAVSVTDDGLYFYHLNDETDVTFSNELGGVVGSTVCGITLDAEFHVYEFYYDGTSLHVYCDNSLVVTIAEGLADQALTPSINVRTGDDGAEIFDIAWIRCFELR